MTIADYKDNHSGERIFILGNGPSLERTPLHLLEDEWTMAMNKIDLLYDETGWRPSYYLSVESSQRREHAKHSIKNVERGITSFVSEHKRRFYPDVDNINYISVDTLKRNDYLHVAREGEKLSEIWSDDATEVVYRLQSSIYSAVQLAMYMGFDEIYFLGCDLYPEFKPFPYMVFDSGNDPTEFMTGERNKETYINFLRENGRPIRSLINGISYKLLRSDFLMDRLFALYSRFGRDENTHFSGEYNPSFYYQVGENFPLIQLHRTIKHIGEHKGFETYNATYGGHLEVYDRVDMEAVVMGDS